MCGQSTFNEDVDVVTETSQDRMLTHVNVPAGLTLKVDRVGQVVTYGDEVVPGETVRFDYYGGSGEGERNVLVVKVDSDGLEGLTLERDGEYRRYADDKISVRSDITIVEPFVHAISPAGVDAVVSGNEKRIRFDEAGEALLASLTGEQLAELYDKHVALIGEGARFDSDSGEVVVKLPEVKSKFEVRSEYFTIQNKKGENLMVFLYPYSQEIGLNVGDLDDESVTPEVLRDELVKFLA